MLAGCPPAPTPSDPPPTDSPTPVDSGLPSTDLPETVDVTVTLDGVPVEGAWVTVGGGMRALTDANGVASVQPDGTRWLIASHPEARTQATEARAETATIELTRFSLLDNPDYAFQDPGVPGERGTTAQCGHCHGSMVVDWAASPHRDSASNPVVHDVFAGTARYEDAAACTNAGGTWQQGIEPGTGAAVERCYLGAGTLPDLNPECGDPASCAAAAETGGCADCHAPGIDGQLGGRSLLEATGLAYHEGIHCDVCHKAESVDLTAAPGVAGALRLLRPSEPSTSPAFAWAPLTFGPYPDVANPRMGASPRDHFRTASFCATCHELVQQAAIPGQSLDDARWPDGLPIHSTFSEWEQGVYAPSSPCQSCHMPPENRYGNSADLTIDAPLIDVASGWFRAPGSVRRHLWDGPRGDGPLLGLAAALDIDSQVAQGELVTTITTRNVGAGHAIPTGEPMRSLILVVEARCGSDVLTPIGGDVVPAFGGALDVRLAGEDWTTWPGAALGDRIRVVSRAGFRDYAGPGRFGDGSFTPEQKGMPVESYVGEATIVAMDGDVATLEPALPTGDVAYRVDGTGLPSDGEPSRAWAGAPGFAFARVLADAQGATQVPHHRAVDILSDNRLVPQGAFTTEHRFSSPCTDPSVTARLMHRAYPLVEARRRAWENTDRQMAEVSR